MTQTISPMRKSNLESRVCAVMRAFPDNFKIQLKGVTVIARLAVADPSTIYLLESAGASDIVCRFIHNYMADRSAKVTITTLAHT